MKTARSYTNGAFILAIAASLMAVPLLADETSTPATTPVAPGVTFEGPHLLVGPKDFIRDYASTYKNGDINVVVEIPTGTTEKWEVTHKKGHLKWEFRDGSPRNVDYLGYPGNYGMIPQTEMDTKTGGDGGPIDAIILGPPIPRGTVVRARPIAILKLYDKGRRDDKIIAVVPGGEMGSLKSLEELNARYPGAAEILKVWFANYKSDGKIQIKGFGGRKDARKRIARAAKSYREAHKK